MEKKEDDIESFLSAHWGRALSLDTGGDCLYCGRSGALYAPPCCLEGQYCDSVCQKRDAPRHDVFCVSQQHASFHWQNVRDLFPMIAQFMAADDLRGIADRSKQVTATVRALLLAKKWINTRDDKRSFEDVVRMAPYFQRVSFSKLEHALAWPKKGLLRRMDITIKEKHTVLLYGDSFWRECTGLQLLDATFDDGITKSKRNDAFPNNLPKTLEVLKLFGDFCRFMGDVFDFSHLPHLKKLRVISDVINDEITLRGVPNLTAIYAGSDVLIKIEQKPLPPIQALGNFSGGVVTPNTFQIKKFQFNAFDTHERVTEVPVIPATVTSLRLDWGYATPRFVSFPPLLTKLKLVNVGIAEDEFTYEVASDCTFAGVLPPTLKILHIETSGVAFHPNQAELFNLEYVNTFKSSIGTCNPWVFGKKCHTWDVGETEIYQVDRARQTMRPLDGADIINRFDRNNMSSLRFESPNEEHDPSRIVIDNAFTALHFLRIDFMERITFDNWLAPDTLTEITCRSKRIIGTILRLPIALDTFQLTAYEPQEGDRVNLLMVIFPKTLRGFTLKAPYAGDLNGLDPTFRVVIGK
jgi:hypothetical protein